MFSVWIMWPPRRPHQVPEGPRENENTRGPQQLLSGAPKLCCLNKIFKIDQAFPSLHSQQHRRQNCILLQFRCHIWLNLVSPNDVFDVQNTSLL
jgi:hypothetical protein